MAARQHRQRARNALLFQLMMPCFVFVLFYCFCKFSTKISAKTIIEHWQSFIVAAKAKLRQHQRQLSHTPVQGTSHTTVHTSIQADICTLTYRQHTEHRELSRGHSAFAGSGDSLSITRRSFAGSSKMSGSTYWWRHTKEAHKTEEHKIQLKFHFQNSLFVGQTKKFTHIC